VRESLAIAEYLSGLRYEDIPDKAVATCKRSLLDGLGAIIAATTLAPECQPFVSMALSAGGKEESTIVGFDARCPSFMAAFANGSFSHALDFEDTHDAALVHPNAASIPAAFAVGEALEGVGGKELVTALVAGSDITSRMGLALKRDPIEFGWYMPPILHSFGATAAAGKLLGLTPKQFLDAFSLTLCQSGCSAELTRSPGAVVRAVRDAFSAKTGVVSAFLAEAGVQGFEQPLEGHAGLFRLYGRDGYDLSPLTAGLGHTFEGANVSFKPWPCCRGTHPFLEATLDLARESEIRAEHIESVKLTLSSSPLQRVLCEPLEERRRPGTPIEAKFSIPFVVAAVLVHGEVRLRHFSRQSLEDKRVLRVGKMLAIEVDENLPDGGGVVEVRARGKVFKKATPEYAYGHPENPVSMADLMEKFDDCLSHSRKRISQEARAEVIEAILDLENQGDMGFITEYL